MAVWSLGLMQLGYFVISFTYCTEKVSFSKQNMAKQITIIKYWLAKQMNVVEYNLLMLYRIHELMFC